MHERNSVIGGKTFDVSSCWFDCHIAFPPTNENCDGYNPRKLSIPSGDVPVARIEATSPDDAEEIATTDLLPKYRSLPLTFVVKGTSLRIFNSPYNILTYKVFGDAAFGKKSTTEPKVAGSSPAGCTL
jgi:hypothetical protein